MKVFSMVLILSFLFSCSKDPKKSTEDLETAIEKFNAAFVEADTATLAKMISQDYVHTNGSWKSFGRDKWLTYMFARRQKLDNGELKISAYEMDEVSIEIENKMAIVTARITSETVESDRILLKRFRVTNVWINEDNKWLRKAFHDTMISSSEN